MRQGTGFSRVIKRGEDACRDYGLSMQQLRTFQAEYRSDFAGLTTSQARHVIQTIVGTSSESYASSLKRGGSREVERATMLVIHAHQADFLQLLDAVASYMDFCLQDSREEIFAWIDVLCLPPTEPAPDSWFTDGYWELASATNRVLLYLAPWTHLAPLGRTFCLWELIVAVKLQVRLSVVVGTESDEFQFTDALVNDFRHCEAAIRSISLTSSRCSRTANRARIFSNLGLPYAPQDGGAPAQGWQQQRLRARADDITTDSVIQPVVDALHHWIVLRGLRLLELLAPPERCTATLVIDVGIAMARVDARLDEARALLIDAVTARTRALGQENKVTLDAMLALGKVLLRMQKHMDAVAVLTEVVERAEEAHGRADLRTIEGRQAVAKALLGQGDYQQAEFHLREGLSACRDQHGYGRSVTLDFAFLLASLLSARPEGASEAEKLFSVVFECRLERLGPRDERTVGALAALLPALLSQGKLEEAMKLLLKTCLQRDGLAPTLLPEANDVAKQLREAGRAEEAEGLLRKATEGVRATLALNRGAELNRRGAVEAFLGLASLLQEKGALVEAEELLREALTVAWGLCGQKHLLSFVAVSALADVLLEMGKLPEAEHLFRHVISKAEDQGLDVDHPVHSSATAGLAILLLEKGALEEAHGLLAQTHATAERLHGPKSEAAVAAGANLAVVLRCLGRAAEAAEQCAQSLAAAEELLGPGSAVALSIQECFAEAELDLGNAAAAEAMARELVTARAAAAGSTVGQAAATAAQRAQTAEGASRGSPAGSCAVASRGSTRTDGSGRDGPTAGSPASPGTPSKPGTPLSPDRGGGTPQKWLGAGTTLGRDIRGSSEVMGAFEGLRGGSAASNEASKRASAPADVPRVGAPGNAMPASARHSDALSSAQLLLARILAARGDFEEAERLLVLVVRDRKARLGFRAPETLSAFTHFGSLLRSRGKLDESLAVLKKVIRARESFVSAAGSTIGAAGSPTVSPAGWVGVGGSVTATGTAHATGGGTNSHKGVSFRGEGSAITTGSRVGGSRAAGAGSMRAGGALAALIAGGTTANRGGPASPAAAASPPRAPTASGRQLRELCESRHQLALTLLALGHPQTAFPELRRSLDGFATGLGARHPTALLALRDLGSAQLALGGPPREALASLEAAHEGLRELLGPTHADVVSALSSLALALLAAGWQQEAKRISTSARETAEAALGPEHPVATWVRVNEGQIRLEASMGWADEVAEARRLLQAAETLIKLRAGHSHPDAVRAAALLRSATPQQATNAAAAAVAAAAAAAAAAEPVRIANAAPATIPLLPPLSTSRSPNQHSPSGGLDPWAQARPQPVPVGMPKASSLRRGSAFAGRGSAEMRHVGSAGAMGSEASSSSISNPPVGAGLGPRSLPATSPSPTSLSSPLSPAIARAGGGGGGRPVVPGGWDPGPVEGSSIWGRFQGAVGNLTRSASRTGLNRISPALGALDMTVSEEPSQRRDGLRRSAEGLDSPGLVGGGGGIVAVEWGGAERRRIYQNAVWDEGFLPQDAHMRLPERASATTFSDAPAGSAAGGAWQTGSSSDDAVGQGQEQGGAGRFRAMQQQHTEHLQQQGILPQLSLQPPTPQQQPRPVPLGVRAPLLHLSHRGTVKSPQNVAAWVANSSGTAGLPSSWADGPLSSGGGGRPRGPSATPPSATSSAASRNELMQRGWQAAEEERRRQHVETDTSLRGVRAAGAPEYLAAKKASAALSGGGSTRSAPTVGGPLAGFQCELPGTPL